MSLIPVLFRKMGFWLEAIYRRAGSFPAMYRCLYTTLVTLSLLGMGEEHCTDQVTHSPCSMCARVLLQLR